jgi:transposase-like protein
MTTQAGRSDSDRDVYTQDFIDEAILRVIEGRRGRGEEYRSLRAVCRELDIPKTTLLRWVHRAEDQAANTFLGPRAVAEPGHDCGPRPAPANPARRRRRTDTPVDDQIATLYHQNQRLARENTILKAAIVVLAGSDETQALTVARR